MNLNSTLVSDDHDLHHSNSDSSSVIPCHIFFSSSNQDHTSGFYNHFYQHQNHQLDDHNYAYNNGIKNNVETSIQLTLWKNEDYHEQEKSTATATTTTNNNPVKWMSSKMRLIEKMKKNPDHQPSSSSLESTDLSSNSSSYSPIRVCSDCNTTKTPLWRSGPKGPKSLCNACGIRQRKARRAMAVSAASVNEKTEYEPPAVKIKVQHKEKIARNGLIKKRSKTAVVTSTCGGGSSSKGTKKIGFEDFLINLSKSLAFHRVFPEDEKDAAILLMALSSGLVHG